MRSILPSHALALSLCVVLGLAYASDAVAQRKRAAIPPVTDSALLGGHRGDPATWPMYGGSYGQGQFSDLDQINRGNVKDLKPAWIFRTGVYNVASGYQTTPVVFNGAMYVTTPRVGREHSPCDKRCHARRMIGERCLAKQTRETPQLPPATATRWTTEESETPNINR